MKQVIMIAALLIAATMDIHAQKAFKVEVIGKGPVVYLIPGYSCSGEVWKETVDHLRSNYECHVFTLAGYAGVPKIDTPVLKTVRDQLIAYTKSNNIKKPILIGHSLGAFMSLWISSEQPDLFGKIICVDGLPFVSAIGDSTVSAEKLQQDPRYNPEAVANNFKLLPDSGYIDMNARAMLAQVSDSARARQIATWSFLGDRKTLGYTIVEISTTDLRQVISKIKEPVLVLGSLYGTEANSYKVLNQQYKNVPNKIIHVANSKHFIMYDQPEWMYNQIDSFLK